MVIVIDLDSGEVIHSPKPSGRTPLEVEPKLPDTIQPELLPLAPEPAKSTVPPPILPTDWDTHLDGFN